ncbi:MULTISPECIES: hypothetical protein [unclassified Mesorhizobium]|uniref:hypothetical protein n=1 Tax=unclassified Mesorhizobium TaxID=325217 RepID=UPI000B0880AE|nr:MULTISPECIES: hypothetical protein [unclassified Mesorhizobium]
MRSFTPRMFAISILVAAVPLTGAYASSYNVGETPAVQLQGPRLQAVLGQLQSAVDGVKAERSDRTLSAAQAGMMEKQAAGIRMTAERDAAQNHGRVPTAQYHDILRKIGNIAPTVENLDEHG